MENSGRVADLLIHALNSRTQLEQNKTAKDEKLLKEIEKIGNPKDQKFMDKIPMYYEIVMKCLAVYKIFTIVEYEAGMDTDDAILNAFLLDESKAPSHYEQVSVDMVSRGKSLLRYL